MRQAATTTGATSDRDPTTVISAELEERTRSLLAAVDAGHVDRAAFRGAQYDAGLAWIHFPVGKGGLDLPRDRQAVVRPPLERHPR